MNILLITPGLDKKFNDNYYAYKYITQCGDNISVLTQRQNVNKGGSVEISLSYETDGNLVFHRIFSNFKEQSSVLCILKKYNIIKKIILEQRPDVIFCEELNNFFFALFLKSKFSIPLVLRVEFAYDKDYPYRTMGNKLILLKNKIFKDRLAVLVGNGIWTFACKFSDHVISCYGGDKNKNLVKFSKPYTYIPWPTYIPNNAKAIKKLKDRMVFIGAFDPHKNLSELLTSVPLIFKNTHIKEFIVVGTGIDLHVINELKERFPENIKHFISLGREECLDLIRSSFISYSPAVRGGWGFIGDSWGVETAVLVTNNHYNFHDNVDCVLTNCNDIAERINELYEDERLYANLTSSAYKRFYNEHSAESVGLRYRRACLNVINNNLLN